MHGMGSMVVLLVVVALCIQGTVAGVGYQVSSLTQTAYGYQGSLSLLGPGPYGSDISTLSLQVYYQTQDILRIKIFDPNNQRWEVPYVNQLPLPTSKPSTLDYSISFVNNPFGFAVTRVSTGDVIFNTTSSQFNPMIFEDQYLEISTSLPTNPNLYGIGERMSSFRLPLNYNYTIWARDHGTPTMLNLYGAHPFYLEMRNTGLAHGVFILNSNAQEFDLTTNSLTYKTIGGIFDIFVFLGPDPASVVQQYHTVVGNPHFPPYWGLGWHQCRWGYHNLSETEAVVQNYAKYNIPLDTMWNDIDYMNAYQDFTNDPVRFPQPEVRSFVQSLHANGQHYIMIIDPGINIDTSYSCYTELLAAGAFIKVAGTNTPVNGKVWPGPVIFPDFFHPNATDYWYNQVAAFHAVGPEFDGMWIDMNEISNFCNGDCSSDDEEAIIAGIVKILSDNLVGSNYENPPYVPPTLAPLDTDTVNVTSEQYLTVMYNLHSMYGWSEGVASKLALEKLRGTRSVVISRSTFAGTGHHNGHWLGDNYSSYTDLYYSIPGILTMQLFGVNFVGADICGFGGDTTEELCSRWMELGTLYPFSRNHNSVGQRSQEPYAFLPSTILLDISIESLNRKYTLLPYYYTLFASAHFNATTIWRPLLFEFPTDVNTFGIDQQFMVGPYLLVSPVLTENATSVNAYFPQELWYSYYDGSSLVGNGQYVNLSAPLNFIPIHVRGGGIIPTQQPALTTTAARLNPFGLLVALNKSGYAQGQIYIDDGENLEPITNQIYSLVSFNAAPSGTGGVLTSSVLWGKYTNSSLPALGDITIFGVPNAPSKVVANGDVATFAYNSTTNKLTIWEISLNVISAFTVSWA